MFADYPSAAKITVTCFARFLFVSIYLPPTALWLTTRYLQYDEGKKKPIRRYASVAVILSGRRSRRLGRMLFIPLIETSLFFRNTDPAEVLPNYVYTIISINIQSADISRDRCEESSRKGYAM